MQCYSYVYLTLWVLVVLFHLFSFRQKQETSLRPSGLVNLKKIAAQMASNQDLYKGLLRPRSTPSRSVRQSGSRSRYSSESDTSVVEIEPSRHERSCSSNSRSEHERSRRTRPEPEMVTRSRLEPEVNSDLLSQTPFGGINLNTSVIGCPENLVQRSKQPMQLHESRNEVRGC